MTLRKPTLRFFLIPLLMLPVACHDNGGGNTTVNTANLDFQCSLSASQDTVLVQPLLQESATLTLSCTGNAVSASINGSAAALQLANSQSTASITVSPTQTTNYSATVTSPKGTATYQASIQVITLSGPGCLIGNPDGQNINIDVTPDVASATLLIDYTENQQTFNLTVTGSSPNQDIPYTLSTTQLTLLGQTITMQVPSEAISLTVTVTDASANTGNCVLNLQ